MFFNGSGGGLMCGYVKLNVLQATADAEKQIVKRAISLIYARHIHVGVYMCDIREETTRA